MRCVYPTPGVDANPRCIARDGHTAALADESATTAELLQAHLPTRRCRGVEGWRTPRDTPGYGPRRNVRELAAAKRYAQMWASPSP